MEGHNITSVLELSRTMVLCAPRTEVLVFDSMKYGERLRAARRHAGLSQAQLAERAKVGTQENVSKLERGNADGSEFTAQYAAACGVNPLWLASEEGDMVEDPLIRRVVEALKRVNQDTARYIAVTVEAHAKNNLGSSTETSETAQPVHNEPATHTENPATEKPAVRVVPFGAKKFPQRKLPRIPSQKEEEK